MGDDHLSDFAATPIHAQLGLDEPTDPHDGPRVDDSEVAVERGDQLHSIAVNRVAGASINQLATTFGYSYGGMAGLLKSPQMQKRVADLNEDLLTRAAAGVAKIVLHLDKMLDLELKLALPEDGSTVTYDSSKSIGARRYLIDKVVAQKQVVTNINKPTPDSETANVLVQSREILNKLLEAASQRTTNIQQSPFVKDGKDAVPKALTAGDHSSGG